MNRLYDEETEKSVLGAVLRDNSMINAIFEM